MLLNFFQNACILITFITISNHFFKDKDVSLNPSLKLKIGIGVSSGLLGAILIYNSVHVSSTIIIDFRYIPILLSAIYGGVIPPIIASIMIALVRVFYLGVSQIAIIGLITALVAGFGFSIITYYKFSKKQKWIYSILFLILIFSIASVVAVNDLALVLEMIAIYSGGNIIVAYFLYHYTEYLNENRELHKKLKIQATKDFLTGINNVRQFDNEFNSIANLTMRKQESLSLLYLDVDNFKKVNDTYGHPAGDIILKELAVIFTNTCRSFDVVSRNGGEEFSILLLDCPSEHAFRIAERVRKNVESHTFLISSEISIRITISIGISTYPETTDKIDTLLEQADTALYAAKKSGKNKVIIYKANKKG